MEFLIGGFSNLFVTFEYVARFFAATWFLFLPFFLYGIFKNMWAIYKAIAHAMAQEFVMLELFPPKDIEKSPQTIEQFFYQLSATDKNFNILDREIKGMSNPDISLEIVGKDGVVHFYVRSPLFFRDLVESGLYAQYPGIEIVEVPDYVKEVPRVMPTSIWNFWGVDFKLLKHDAYPIRTYKSFEEDVTGTMIDPLHILFESMSSLAPGQQIWIQFLIKAKNPKWATTVGQDEVDKLTGREKSSTTLFSRLWKDLADVFSGVFVGFFKPPEFDPFTQERKEEQPLEFRLTPGEKKTLTALEENLAKAFYDVKMRLVVVGKHDGFTKANVAAAFGGIMKPFNDNLHNSFIPDGTSKTDVDHLFKSTLVPRRTRKMVERYIYRDNSGATFVMSTEELATLFHMPDMSVTAPGVQFASSRRGGSPSNLPFSF